MDGGWEYPSRLVAVETTLADFGRRLANLELDRAVDSLRRHLSVLKEQLESARTHGEVGRQAATVNDPAGHEHRAWPMHTDAEISPDSIGELAMLPIHPFSSNEFAEAVHSRITVELANLKDELTDDLLFKLPRLVESQLANQRDAVSAQASVPVQHNSDACQSGESALGKTTRQEVDELMRKQSFEPLQQSFWEVFIVCGESGQTTLEIIAAFFSLLLVIGMNVLVCLILVSEFANNVTSVAAAQTWRRSSGHWSLFAAIDGESMVHQMCDLDHSLIMSASQKQQYAEADKYHTTVAWNSLGMILCDWCLLVFFFLIWEEVQATIVRASTVLHIPRAHKTILLVSGEGFTMKAISVARVTCVLWLCLLRITVAVVLLYAGSLWLMYTENIENLILNSAALVFVLDIDELVYRIACPASIKASLESLEPLSRPSVGSLHFPLRAISTLIGSVCALLFWGFVWMRPFADDVLDLKKAFCGGNTDFVVATNAPTGIVYAYSRNPSLAENKGALMWTVVDELIDGSRNANHISEQTYADFEASVGSSLNDMIVRFGGLCRDTVATGNSSQATGAMMAALAHAIGFSASVLTNCSQLNSGHCMMDLAITHLACPETCGCSRAFEGFFPTTGCPIQRCSSASRWVTGRANQPRTDIDVEVLQYVPQWNRYWQSFNASHAKRETLTDWAAQGLTEQELVQKFKQFGCRAMDYFGTQPRYWILVPQMLHFFCDEYTDKWRPLSIFCPDTCGCSRFSFSTSKFCALPAPVNASANAPLKCPGLTVRGGAVLQNSQCGQHPSSVSSPEGWYNCSPNAYNGRNVYMFIDASAIVWELRWETTEQYNWGAYFLGQRVGLQRTAKWTLNRLNQQRRPATGFRQRVGLFFSSSFTFVPSEQGWLPRNYSTTDFDCAVGNNITAEGADRYYLAPKYTNHCPQGYDTIHYLTYTNTSTVSDTSTVNKSFAISVCQRAAVAFGSKYNGEETESTYPKGCYMYAYNSANGPFYLNWHLTGSIDLDSYPVCEKHTGVVISSPSPLASNQSTNQSS